MDFVGDEGCACIQYGLKCWVNVDQCMEAYEVICDWGYLAKVNQPGAQNMYHINPGRLLLGRKMSKRIPLGFVGGMFVTVSIFG